MPDVNGIELATYLKLSQDNSDAKVFVLSGFVDQPALMKANELGVIEIIEKPCNFNDLVERVKARLSVVVPGSVGPEHEIVSKISETFRKFFDLYMDGKVTTDKAELKSNDTALASISSVVPVFGERMYGSFAMSFQKEFITKMFNEVFLSEQENMDSQALANFAKDVTRQFVKQLDSEVKKLGYAVSFGLCDVLVGEDSRISHQVPAETISWTISSKSVGGKCFIGLSLVLPQEIQTEAGEPKAS